MIFMKKGISAIIATIMLLMITVALIGVFYVFGSILMGGSTGAAGSAATATTDRMLKSIAVSNERCSNTSATNNIINFTVQNIGTKDIVAGELSVYVDNVLDKDESPDLTATGLAANAQMPVGVNVSSYRKTRSLQVVGPANPVTMSLTC